MNNYRVRAFTILEVTVAMLISSLVIGITYTVYTIVSKSFIVYQRDNNHRASLIRLDELLKKDFDWAEDILAIPDGIALKKGSKTIIYQINKQFIVRTASVLDSFKFTVQETHPTFENIPVAGTDVNEEQNRIDDLQLILLFDDKKINYHYHKEYSSANLIQRNQYAIN